MSYSKQDGYHVWQAIIVPGRRWSFQILLDHQEATTNCAEWVREGFREDVKSQLILKDEQEFTVGKKEGHSRLRDKA